MFFLVIVTLVLPSITGNWFGQVVPNYRLSEKQSNILVSKNKKRINL